MKGEFVFYRREDPLSRDERAFQKAQADGTEQAYITYLEAFGAGTISGKYAKEAERALNEVIEISHWENLKKYPTKKGFESFILRKNGFSEEALALYQKTYGVPFPSPNFGVFTPNMVHIRGGLFQMGSELSKNESPIHDVIVHDFLLSSTTVSFDDFDAFCDDVGRDKPNDQGWGRGTLPVINIDWYNCLEYCNWLSKKENLEPVYNIDRTKVDPVPKNQSGKKWLIRLDREARGYRLPTEAEWEFAARTIGRTGGRNVRYGNGKNQANSINMNCAFQNTTTKGTVSVSHFPPNGIGLFNMSGNVYEWCEDWYSLYNKKPRGNPIGQGSAVAGFPLFKFNEIQYFIIVGPGKVIRGGSWKQQEKNCRTTSRAFMSPDSRSDEVGFRIARSL